MAKRRDARTAAWNSPNERLRVQENTLLAVVGGLGLLALVWLIDGVAPGSPIYDWVRGSPAAVVFIAGALMSHLWVRLRACADLRDGRDDGDG